MTTNFMRILAAASVSSLLLLGACSEKPAAKEEPVAVEEHAAEDGHDHASEEDSKSAGAGHVDASDAHEHAEGEKDAH